MGKNLEGVGDGVDEAEEVSEVDGDGGDAHGVETATMVGMRVMIRVLWVGG